MPVPWGRWHHSPASPAAPRSMLPSSFGVSVGNALYLKLCAEQWLGLCLLISILLLFLLTSHSSPAPHPQAPLPLASSEPSLLLPYPSSLLSCIVCSPISHLHSCLPDHHSCHHHSFVLSSVSHLLISPLLYCPLTLWRHPEQGTPPSCPWPVLSMLSPVAHLFSQQPRVYQSSLFKIMKA